MKKFEDLLEACGGSLNLAYKLGVRQGTVEGWRSRGVPLKYWEKINKITRGAYTPAVAYKINLRCDNARSRRSA